MAQVLRRAETRLEIGGNPVNAPMKIFVHALEGEPEDLKNFSGKTERDIRVRWLLTNELGGPVGTGPWKVKHIEPHKIIILERSGVGEQPKYINEVHLPFIPDGSELTERLQLDAGHSNCVHFAPVLTDPSTLSSLRLNPQVQIVTIPGLSLFYLGFYTDRPPFSDENLRKAVVSAINVYALAPIAQGAADPAVAPVPPCMVGHDPNLHQDRFDPATAKSLLEKALTDNNRPLTSLTFTYVRATSYANSLAHVVAKQITDSLGLKVDPNEPPNWEDLVRAVKAKQGDMFLYTWHQRVPHPNDPRDFLTALFHSENRGTTNLTWYKNTAVDGLLNSGTPGDLHKAQTTIIDEAPMAFLVYPKRNSAFHRAVKKPNVGAGGLPADKLKEVDIG
jgi:peptide/nickel transport system substrate-binding protein